MRPEAYGEEATLSPSSSPEVELIETHISLVFLVGSHVYKVKKPVYLGFLDFRTVEERKRACEAEVTLNRRLAPHVYLGVVPVRRSEGGQHTIVGDGPIVDWAVHMIRLSDAGRADIRAADGALDRSDIDRIAFHIARFHEGARCDEETSRFGTAEAVAVNVRENFEQTRGSVESYLRREEAEEIERFQVGLLEANAALLSERIAKGRVRDGHGDLRLEHVYLEEDGRVTIIDCIEFNDRFRYADTCSDIAFLSMDLAWHGRVDLAEQLLAAYARETGDFDLYPLVDFYEGYRAYVRGKVATILASDPEAGESAKARAAAEARRYFLLSLAAKRALVVSPSVVAVGGVIASGKSTVARAVSGEMSAPVVEADRTRKQMLGVAPTTKLHDPSWQGAYDPRFTEEVYAEVLRRAGRVLASGRPVIIDASFRSAKMREQARALAEKHGVPFRFIECSVADREVCRERLRARQASSAVSDGRLEIFDDFCDRFEAVTELSAEVHVRVDTEQPLDATLVALRQAVSTWPRGLVS